ncbi:cytochrome c-type biogenesis protein CcmH [Alteromonas ponticola]|uniref:Cytochrome c-type biogenesis protein n=1 Tax=Alteromonas aquimaris TaxID=2998417 RepID=A0ABT3P2I4_9ALTE|nr:cytochrome c-type biogenesis protein CcmH [Alteromonas aquimaris]MCW8106963.1 cytochrome c-type biogenesis protein CcmH [Alteromonas aquimaris]
MSNRITVLSILLLALAFVTDAYAAKDRYEFDDPAQREAFLKLTAELRCPMCQNQNIADSDAMIAQDMRRKVFRLLQEGKSEEEVISYMKSRYGDFIYYQPPVTMGTIWLWLLPIAFAVIAVVVLIVRKQQQRTDSDAEKLAKAERILEQDKS